MHNYFCVFLELFFRGEFAGTGHAILFEALWAVTILGVLWLVPALAHLSKAGFIVYDRFQAYG